MEFVLAVIVGLLSGAVGALVGPVVVHRLGRRQRQEQRAEHRHAELRTMIDVRMADARRHVGKSYIAATIIRSDFEARRATVLKYLEEELAAWREHPYHWQPYRIDDPQLREGAMRLNTLDLELHELITAIEGVSPDEVGKWTERIVSTATEVEALIKKISLRLDELGW